MEGRDNKGRWAQGNSGGPGRPRRDTEAAYLAALADACPPDRWRAIVARAVSDAEAGDAKAREWLGAYLIGRPVAHVVQDVSVEDVTDRDEGAARAEAAAEILRQLFPGAEKGALIETGAPVAE